MSGVRYKILKHGNMNHIVVYCSVVDQFIKEIGDERILKKIDLVLWYTTIVRCNHHVMINHDRHMQINFDNLNHNIYASNFK